MSFLEVIGQHMAVDCMKRGLRGTVPRYLPQMIAMGNRFVWFNASSCALNRGGGNHLPQEYFE